MTSTWLSINGGAFVNAVGATRISYQDRHLGLSLTLGSVDHKEIRTATTTHPQVRKDAIFPSLLKGQPVSALNIHVCQTSCHCIESRGHNHGVELALYPVLANDTGFGEFLNGISLQVDNVNILLIKTLIVVLFQTASLCSKSKRSFLGNKECLLDRVRYSWASLLGPELVHQLPGILIKEEISEVCLVEIETSATPKLFPELFPLLVGQAKDGPFLHIITETRFCFPKIPEHPLVGSLVNSLFEITQWALEHW